MQGENGVSVDFCRHVAPLTIFNRDFSESDSLETLKYALKHGYSQLGQDAKKHAIRDHPLETFRHAVGSGYHGLVGESAEEALYRDPVEVFRLASEHGHVDLARIVAEKFLFLTTVGCGEGEDEQSKLENFIKRARVARDDHVFSVLQFATEHKLEDLMECAAVMARERPKFALAVDQLNSETLAVWVSQSD